MNRRGQKLVLLFSSFWVSEALYFDLGLPALEGQELGRRVTILPTPRKIAAVNEWWGEASVAKKGLCFACNLH